MTGYEGYIGKQDPKERRAFFEVERQARAIKTRLDEITGSVSSVDHGALLGLLDNDHPQYATNVDLVAEGSVRADADAALGGRLTTAENDLNAAETQIATNAANLVIETNARIAADVVLGDKIDQHVDDADAVHHATAISFSPSGTVSSTNAAAAIFEVASDASAELSAHIDDAVDAHDASAVSVTTSGWSPLTTSWFTATTVQDGILQLASEIDGRIEAGDVNAIIDAINTWTGGDSTITTPDVFSAGLIVTTALAAGAVVASKIAANAVTTVKLDANAVTAAKIAAGTITANEIAAGTITASQIAAGTITATQIAAGTITTSQLNANAISSTAPAYSYTSGPYSNAGSRFDLGSGDIITSNFSVVGGAVSVRGDVTASSFTLLDGANNAAARLVQATSVGIITSAGGALGTALEMQHQGRRDRLFWSNPGAASVVVETGLEQPSTYFNSSGMGNGLLMQFRDNGATTRVSQTTISSRALVGHQAHASRAQIELRCADGGENQTSLKLETWTPALDGTNLTLDGQTGVVGIVARELSVNFPGTTRLWIAPFGNHASIQSNHAHIILGSPADGSLYLRTKGPSPVQIGQNWSNTLTVGDGTTTVHGDLVVQPPNATRTWITSNGQYSSIQSNHCDLLLGRDGVDGSLYLRTKHAWPVHIGQANSSTLVVGNGVTTVNGSLTVTGALRTDQNLQVRGGTIHFGQGNFFERAYMRGTWTGVGLSHFLDIGSLDSGNRAFVRFLNANVESFVTRSWPVTHSPSDWRIIQRSDGFLGIDSSPSMRKVKKHIHPATDEHRAVLDLEPSTFVMRQTGDQRIGLIAEDTASVDPRFALWGADLAYDEEGELVRDADGEMVKESDKQVPTGIYWDAITTSLIGVCQDQQKAIASLNVRVEELEAKVNK